jgi:predicted nucleic acid-binding protein
MIIVDTSIWVEFFRLNPDYVQKLTSLLENRQVATLEPVFAELVYGSKSVKEKNVLMAYWNVLPKYRLSDGYLLDAAEFANLHNHQNLGIGLIDTILIKVTIENEAKLWTLDKKLIKCMNERFLF